MRRLNCEMYPCHFPDQDCAFCFCPFYPCMDEATKGCLSEGVWNCGNCRAIHRPEVSDAIMDALMAGEALPDVWKRFKGLL
jgi:threonine-phosphate decarboxylase